VLEVYFPSYRLERDHANPLIWHVYDMKVAALPDYPLTKEVRDFAFSGAVRPFFALLAKAGPHVAIIEEFSIVTWLAWRLSPAER